MYQRSDTPVAFRSAGLLYIGFLIVLLILILIPFRHPNASGQTAWKRSSNGPSHLANGGRSRIKIRSTIKIKKGAQWACPAGVHYRRINS